MKNRGFTLVEMLAVLVILGLLIGIGVFTVNNIKDNAEKNYYVSMEDTLKMAGNDYFNDNREDRPIDDYNFVSLETLEDHEYLDVLKTYDKKENCDKSSGVYIYNTDNGNEYEVCLKCGIHKSGGVYCNGKKTGQIMITGRTNTSAYYNPTLSYVGTPWVNASSINVTFTLMGDDVTTDKFEIYNGNTNSNVGECTNIHSNSCTTNMSVTGSYYVIAYNGSEKVGNRKYFNVKIDNTPPTFDIKDQEPEKDLENGYEYPYNNEVINIHDDNGYRSAVFSLIEDVATNPRINIVNKDLTATNLQIIETLPSGKYRLTVTVTDYAKNSTTKSITFTIKYNVNMVYFDNTETRHDMGTIRVYTNGFYDDLLKQVTLNGKTTAVDWYDNTNYNGRKYDNSTKVEKTSTHTLYGREQRIVIPVSDEPHCNNLNDFTYNNNNQELVTAKEGYHLTNNIQKNAGTHTIIAMPDANFIWADNTRTYKIVQCTIKRYPIAKPVDPCVGGLVYNNNDHVLIKSAYGGDTGKISDLTPTKVMYTYSPTKKKNAGNYNVVFKISDKANVEWNDGTTDDQSYTCTIKKYQMANPVEPCVSGLIYNGKDQILIKDTYGGSTGKIEKLTPTKTMYTYSPTTKKDAGSYSVVFKISDKTNVEWSDGTGTDKAYTCSIKKYKLTTPSSPCKTGLVYNAQSQGLIVSSYGTTAHIGDVNDPSDSYGEYKVFTHNEVAYRFYPSLGLNAGSYPVLFHILDNKNFEWSDGTTANKSYTCEIAKYTVTKPTDACKSGLVYNGKDQTLVKQSFIDNNKTTFNAKAYNINPITGQDAKTYTVSFTLYDANNYIWSDKTSTAKTFNCKIDRYKTSFSPSSSPCLPNLVYTGVLQPLVNLSGGRGSGTSYTHFSPLFDSSSGYGMGDYSISNCQASWAGDYEVVYSLTNSNYAWADGSTGDKTYTCTINKAPVTWSTAKKVVYAGYSAKNTTVNESIKTTNGDSVPLILTATTVKSPNVYNAKVAFASSADESITSNYYITNPSTTIGFTNAAVTITADSDSKEYDGKALTKNSYKESGTVAANGESISSVTVTGSQTIPGKSDNVPSNAVIKYGGFITTSYYNITYTKGTLEVKDTQKPNCSLSISESGTITASASDNYQLAYSGFSSSYSGTSSTSKTVTSAGSTTYYVKDTSGNTNTCSITYEKVKQKRTYSCNTYNSCATSACGCNTYNSCATSGCGCKTYKTCTNSACGCKTYKTCTNSACGCSEYKTCTSSACGCSEYNSCATSGCGCSAYYSCANSACGCSEYNDWEEYSSGCTHTAFTYGSPCNSLNTSGNYTKKECTKELANSNGEQLCYCKCYKRTCKKYKTCATSGCGCKTYNTCANSACGCKTYATCANSACGCNSYNSCATSACGCSEYNSCATSACGCSEYNTCADSACGCKTYNTCANNACGCKTWNNPTAWVDDSSCSASEASDHKSKTECQTIFRKK